MAASEFAKRLAKHLPEASFIGGTALKDYVPRQRMIDAELQEVREVLDSFRREFQNSDVSCFEWHRCRELDKDDEHTEDCLRARALWSKLKVKE
jgi:hypothetical protein